MPSSLEDEDVAGTGLGRGEASEGGTQIRESGWGARAMRVPTAGPETEWAG